jgi:hypothetical protein
MQESEDIHCVVVQRQTMKLQAQVEEVGRCHQMNNSPKHGHGCRDYSRIWTVRYSVPNGVGLTVDPTVGNDKESDDVSTARDELRMGIDADYVVHYPSMEKKVGKILQKRVFV